MDRDFNKALSYSFLLLKYRARSKNEIICRLQKKKFNKPIVKKVLDYLEEKRYINDKEFTDSFVLSCKEKGWGPRKILFALQKFKVDTGITQDALKDREGFKQKIKELADKKADYYKGPARRQKLTRFLLSRGFFGDDVREVLGQDETEQDEY